MSKQYGLIDPKASKATSKPALTKHAAFDSDFDDSDSAADPKKSLSMELGESQKRQARAAQAKALAEDPTVYQYDELYDEIDSKRKESKESKSQEEKKPKYIGKLLETAEKRKKEQERRIERQVQKEREAEGEMYKDKESFVTSAYRAKLEEMKKAEDEEKREEYLENIGDVTKQSDLGGFYRHIYSQKMGEASEQKKEKNEENVKKKDDVRSSESEEDKKKRQESDEEESARMEALKSKEFSHSKVRRYRKRNSEDEQNDDSEEKNDSSKKVHLQSNLDADSDFSIDSNSSSSHSENDNSSDDSDAEHGRKSGDKERSKERNSSSPEKKKPKVEDSEAPANGLDNGDKPAKENGKEAVAKVEEPTVKETKKPKEPKVDIWKKRTVGPAFDAALQRYYERKAARESG